MPKKYKLELTLEELAELNVKVQPVACSSNYKSTAVEMLVQSTYLKAQKEKEEDLLEPWTADNRIPGGWIVVDREGVPLHDYPTKKMARVLSAAPEMYRLIKDVKDWFETCRKHGTPIFGKGFDKDIELILNKIEK